MNYSALLDVECPYPEVCAAAGLPANSKFGAVLVELLGALAARPSERKLDIHVTFDRDSMNRGFAEDGKTPLSPDELRAVLEAKIHHAGTALADLKQRLADLDGPRDASDEVVPSIPPAVN
jgi:hypothetical protein